MHIMDAFENCEMSELDVSSQMTRLLCDHAELFEKFKRLAWPGFVEAAKCSRRAAECGDVEEAQLNVEEGQHNPEEAEHDIEGVQYERFSTTQQDEAQHLDVSLAAQEAEFLRRPRSVRFSFGEHEKGATKINDRPLAVREMAML
jgi:hypothetical protein